MTSIYYIYPRVMTEVNVSATVEMCLRQWEKCQRQWGNVCDSGGNVRNSGEIDHGLENSRVEIAIHNVA